MTTSPKNGKASAPRTVTHKNDTYVLPGPDGVDDLHEMWLEDDGIITGDMVPGYWHRHIRNSLGQPAPMALLVLARIVYWHRVKKKYTLDEETGHKILEAKFDSHLWWCSLPDLASYFGMKKQSVSEVIDRLVELGLVKKHPMPIPVKERKTILYVELLPAKLAEWRAAELASLRQAGRANSSGRPCELVRQAVQGSSGRGMPTKSPLSQESPRDSTTKSPPGGGGGILPTAVRGLAPQPRPRVEVEKKVKANHSSATGRAAVPPQRIQEGEDIYQQMKARAQDLPWKPTIPSSLGRDAAVYLHSNPEVHPAFVLSVASMCLISAHEEPVPAPNAEKRMDEAWWTRKLGKLFTRTKGKGSPTGEPQDWFAEAVNNLTGLKYPLANKWDESDVDWNRQLIRLGLETEGTKAQKAADDEEKLVEFRDYLKKLRRWTPADLKAWEAEVEESRKDALDYSTPFPSVSQLEFVRDWFKIAGYSGQGGRQLEYLAKHVSLDDPTNRAKALKHLADKYAADDKAILVNALAHWDLGEKVPSYRHPPVDRHENLEVTLKELCEAEVLPWPKQKEYVPVVRVKR